MKKLPHNTDELRRVARGVLARAGRPKRFGGITADTRTVRSGDAFFCLQGERTDGHLYAPHASARGASVIVAKAGHAMPPIPPHSCVVRVKDPLEAMRAWASHCRRVLKGPVIGVTGSNGKTTVKEMIASILVSAEGSERVLKSAGNHNTDIGLAMTLAQAQAAHRFAVLEMAMRGPGQIRRLAQTARPNVGVITSIGPAHLALLGSIPRIARAKAELLDELEAGGTAVYPDSESKRLGRHAGHIPRSRHWTFGMTPKARIRLVEAVPDRDSTRVALAEDGVTHVIRLPLIGAHHGSNAACAAAASRSVGLDWHRIRLGLQGMRVPEMRGTLHEASGRKIINDCYNANPASMAAGLEALYAAARGRRTYAVLGDMLELGRHAAAYHRKIGAIAGRSGIAGVAVTGAFAAAVASAAKRAGCRKVVVEPTPEAAAAKAASWTKPGDVVLVKASRGSRLEKAFDELMRILSHSGERGREK